MTLGEMSREGGAAVAAGGSESPGPHPEPSGNRTGRPLLRLPEGREVDVLPGVVPQEAWGVCGASLDVSSTSIGRAITVKSC